MNVSCNFNDSQAVQLTSSCLPLSDISDLATILIVLLPD